MRRFKVLGLGLAVGAALSLFVAGTIPFADFATLWGVMMAGPIVGTYWGMIEYQPVILLGWAGLLLIPLHPISPRRVMGCLTGFGLLLWFYSGLVTVVVATA
jgi:hypothetical protein